MKCPFCGHLETQVVETRESEEGDVIRRRRRCAACDQRFTTYERAEVALPQVVNTPELRFDCDDHRKFEVVKEVAARLKTAGATVSETDGVRVLTADGWWLLRSSNTQAVLVARCEASSEAGLERLKAALVAQLEASGLAAPDFSGANAGH